MTVVVSRSHTVFCPRVEPDKQDPCEGVSCNSNVTLFDRKREQWVAAGWTLVDSKDEAQMLDEPGSRRGPIDSTTGISFLDHSGPPSPLHVDAWEQRAWDVSTAVQSRFFADLEKLTSSAIHSFSELMVGWSRDLEKSYGLQPKPKEIERLLDYSNKEAFRHMALSAVQKAIETVMKESVTNAR